MPETNRNQVNMTLSKSQYTTLIRKYKAYVAKCKDRIMPLAAWAREQLLA